MARIPDNEIERLKKEVALERLVLGFGVEPGGVAEDEPVALPGEVQRGRVDHRLGHKDEGSELPACRRVAQSR